jgi:hypothetical protein
VKASRSTTARSRSAVTAVARSSASLFKNMLHCCGSDDCRWRACSPSRQRLAQYREDTAERHVLYAQSWALLHHALHSTPQRRESSRGSGVQAGSGVRRLNRRCRTPTV